MAPEPVDDRRMFMGGVVVGDDMDGEIGRALLIDQLEEGQPFLMTMARRQTGDQFAFQIIAVLCSKRRLLHNTGNFIDFPGATAVWSLKR